MVTSFRLLCLCLSTARQVPDLFWVFIVCFIMYYMAFIDYLWIIYEYYISGKHLPAAAAVQMARF